jgi:YD repeat-containing protein
MIGKRFAILLVLIGAQCVLSTHASAQNTCIASSLLFWGDNIPPGWVCGPGEGPYSMVCSGPSGKCGALSWCPTCGIFVPTGGSPINLANGNTYIQQEDVKIPGLGGGLNLQRTWDSIWPATVSAFQSGMFGANWRSTYEERVFLNNNNMVYLRSDGGYWIFASDGNLVAPANIIAALSQGSTYWTLAFQNGEQRQFSVASGSLTAIIDRNGNTTQLSYDSLNRLTTVTDPASRTLSFTYASNSSPLVTGVSSSVGLSLSYAYDTSGRLTQVTKPDQTMVSFQYNTNSMITSVNDSNGKVLESHTYDSSGRGLTSARANGVQALTVTYP